jgi:hypothetical protein
LESRNTTLTFIIVLLASLSVLVALTWANYRFAVQNPGGNDFLPRWLGVRKFLMEGVSPYSPETTQEIQEMLFARSAQPTEDQSLFVYPFYALFIMAPFSLIGDYETARAVWMTALEVSLVLLAGIGISLSRWKLRPVGILAMLVFAALWYHGVRSVVNGNPAVLSALFIGAAFMAIRAEQDGLAGLFLALATIKPQMLVLLAPFIIIWSISRQRWLILWSFLGCLALLIGSTMLLIPDWPVQNLRQVLSYPLYTSPGTPGGIFAAWMPGVGRQLGWLLTVVLGGILIWEWRAARGKDFAWFLWTACLTLAITNLVGVRTATDNFLALFPAIVLVFATWHQQWGILGRGLVNLNYLLLFVGLWWLFLATVQAGDQVQQHPVMFFPVPVFVLVTLYWIRWWALRPVAPLLDELRRSQGDYAL